MPALVAGIHVLKHCAPNGVDGRDKHGHDDDEEADSGVRWRLSKIQGKYNIINIFTLETKSFTYMSAIIR
jgi:hypothetical protein